MLDISDPALTKGPSVFCAIYTHSKGHWEAKNAARAWLPFCDGAVIASDVQDEAIPTTFIAQEMGKHDEYNDMWRKTVAIIRYITNNVAPTGRFDYYMLIGPDAYVLMGNLRRYLSQPIIANAHAKGEPLFIGRRFKEDHIVFNAGGSGYLLNSHALEKLKDGFNAAEALMRVGRKHACDFLRTPKEDVKMAVCLIYLGIPTVDTRDAQGRDRFHPYTHGMHLYFLPKWLSNQKRLTPSWAAFKDRYASMHCGGAGNPLRVGLDAVSPSSISFHYLKNIPAVHKLLHRCYRAGVRGARGLHEFPDGCDDMTCAANLCKSEFEPDRMRCKAWKLFHARDAFAAMGREERDRLHDAEEQYEPYAKHHNVSCEYEPPDTGSRTGKHIKLMVAKQRTYPGLPHTFPERTRGPSLWVERSPPADFRVRHPQCKPEIDDDEDALMESLFELGKENPRVLLEKLESEDPLGVRRGESSGLPPGASSKFEAPCPTRRFGLPDLRNRTAEAKFRGGGGLLFYQHLRKSGGSSFCELARDNLGRDATPAYFCMIDGAGRLATPPHHSPSSLVQMLRNNKKRVVSNEWDTFPPQVSDELPRLTDAVFATTMRDPAKRWWSLYRFEHLESRDGRGSMAPMKHFLEWYNGWMRVWGANYYTKTFMRVPYDYQKHRVRDSFHWTYEDLREHPVCWAELQRAMRTLRTFNVVLLLEWMVVPAQTRMLKSSLGWGVAPKEVLPSAGKVVHKESRYKTHDKNRSEVDAGLARVREDNWVDVLFYEWVQRLALERLLCDGHDGKHKRP